MNKKILFVICILFVIIFCMVNTFFVNSSYAKAVKRDDLSFLEGETIEEIDPINNPSSFDPGLTAPTDINSSKFINKVGIILGAIRNISVVIAVVVLMIIGLKYMMGSVEEKASYKQTMMPYVIGAVLSVSGTTLVAFIYNSVH